MNFRLLVTGLLVCMSFGCNTKKTPQKVLPNEHRPEVTLQQLQLFDTIRQREIPIAIFRNKTIRRSQYPVVIFNHGYGQNSGDSYLKYSYLTTFLAEEGFLVISVQHELPDDEPIPLAGIPQVVRRPFWLRGAANIHYVIGQLPHLLEGLEIGELILLGHSNGADMIALFPELFPDKIDKIITLDNRRMPLPCTKSPRIYSIRSSDLPADDGVLPDSATIARLGIQIIPSPVRHDDMDDHATDEEQLFLRRTLLRFLKD